MNPLTNIRSLNNLIDNEIKLGRVGTKVSWHEQYRESAWVFFGGMPFELTEGDIICVFSQYGEIVNINLVRDRKTGKSKGFGFLCYENQKSTDLAVDNFNGTKILERLIRVDHVLNYKPPKDTDEIDDMTKFLREEGCATKVIEEKKETIKEIIQRKSETVVRVKKEYDDRPRDRYSDNQKSSRNEEYDRERRREDKEKSRDGRERSNRSSDLKQARSYKARRHSSSSRSRSKSPTKSSRRRSNENKPSRNEDYRKRRSRSGSRSNSPKRNNKDYRKESKDSYGRYETKRH